METCFTKVHSKFSWLQVDFCMKHLPDDAVDRYKAHLVAKGFHQHSGVYYHDTFSPVVKPTTVCHVLSLAVNRWCPFWYFHVNNAFLQGTLTEDVYMSQPSGFVDHDHPHHFCKLCKAIYGLKLARRAWYHELRQFLVTSVFCNSHADISLFAFHTNGITMYLLVYTDDIVIIGDNDTIVQEFIQLLACRFSIKDLGHLSYFLVSRWLLTMRAYFCHNNNTPRIF